MRKVLAMLLALVLIWTVPGAGIAEEAAENAAVQYTDEMLYPFFGNCIFVGDSITRQLRAYTLKQRKTNPDFLKGARFYAAQNYMLFVASWKTLHEGDVNLVLSGNETTLTNLIDSLKPKYVFILLGVNDYIGETIDKGIGYVKKIIRQAREVSPDTVIVFQSLTPVTRSFCRKKDYRTMWDDYNIALKETCEANGAIYLEIAAPLKDEEGYLPESYSSDGKYHLSDEGLKIWVQCLMDFARSEAETGNWQP